MFEKIDAKRLITDITGPLRAGINFHKEKDFHNFLELAQTPMGWVLMDTWVFSSFLVRPEEMDHLYDYYFAPSAKMFQRCLERCARGRALLLLTAKEQLPDVIGTVVGDYEKGHTQGINVTLTNTDVIGAVVQIDNKRFTVIEYDEGQIHLDPVPTKPITSGSEIRAGFRNEKVDLAQGGVTVVTVPIPIPRGLDADPKWLGRPTEIFETDDFCLRASVGWRASEVKGQEGHYQYTIDFLCGFIINPDRIQLSKAA